jgi:hypothetical protein
MAKFNFVGKKTEPSDIPCFFDADEVLLDILENETNMAHLLARIGKFTSVKDAKRNGWDKPIPTGWSEFVIGRGINRTDVHIWNPTCTLEEFDEAAFDAEANIN